jgi:GAF domain-containing protein
MISLAGLISEQLSQIEAALDTAATSNPTRLGGNFPFSDTTGESSHHRADAVDSAALLLSVRDLHRQIDRLLFLEGFVSIFASPLSFDAVITHLMDSLWQRNQFAFAALVLGESELGPYFYNDLRGVIDARRYLKKQCPLPLWGELAHALVRRLDPEEPDYLFINDVAASGRPTIDEFPWMPRRSSVIILPLRKGTVAIGALILGGKDADSFGDAEFRLELIGFAGVAERTIANAQAQEELHNRSEQLVGLQLFTRSIAVPTTARQLVTTIVDGLAELMGAASILIAFHRTFAKPHLLEQIAAAPGSHTQQELVGIGSIPNDDLVALFGKLHRLLTWTIDAGQALFLDPSQPLESPENLYYNETGRALMTPITIGETPLGVLYIEAPPNVPGYDEEDMVVLRTALNAIAIALQQVGA